jgi:hypothetical protein
VSAVVVRGRPTDAELAALVVALAAVARPPAPGPTPEATLWTLSARPARAYPDGRPVRRGPDAWAHAARPR